ncbi:MAG: S16 family serine protease, partial [Thermoplasmatota archaeon]
MRKKTIRSNPKKAYKTILLLTLVLLMLQTISVQTTIATTPGEISNENISIEYRNVTVYAPAVGQTADGYVGVISTVTVTIQNQGSGRVFVDTLPLAQIDMQGSARLAVKVASALVENDPNCSVNPDNYDYFFVIRTKSPIIGGPSAGGILTTAVVALLEGWDLDDQTVMTGMINPDGSIGPIGGITKKIDAANSVGATRFLIPEGQGTYTETIYETIQTAWGQQIVSHQVTRNVSDYAQENYGIEVVEVADIKDVIYYYTGYEYEVT